MSQTILLFGDSIIDNKYYVGENENSVLEHLQNISNDEFIQIALDGDTTRDVLDKQLQVSTIRDASKIILSVGGNDLLQNLSFLYKSNFENVNEGLICLQNQIFQPLTERYEAIVKVLSSYRANLLLCTVYEGDLGRTDEFRGVLDSSKIMASSFNDIVYKTAKKFNADVLELRQIFTESDDYANPIEP
ncbi:MAG: SGNH/GDSL hydrolase family protein, partial [Burkholderiaceae bacterium]